MKNITLLILLSLASIFSSAQNRFFEASLLGGATFSQVDGDHLGGYNKLGGFVGFELMHPLNEKLEARLEIDYWQKGSKRRLDPEDPNPQIFILKFHYVELPLLLVYDANFAKLIGGISIGTNVLAQRDEGLGFKDASLKAWEYALHLGAEFALSDKLNAQVRHSVSVFRVGDPYPNGANIINRIGLFNRVFAVGLSYGL